MSLPFSIFLSTFFILLVGFWMLKTPLNATKAKSFLRSKPFTIILYGIACTWFLYKVLTLGEADFGEYKYVFFLIFSTIASLAYFWVPDLLLVRALGILGLLISDYLLKLAYMQEHSSRLVLVTGVYFLIIISLAMGAMPFLARSFIDFLSSNEKYYSLFYFILIGYGILLLLSLLSYL